MISNDETQTIIYTSNIIGEELIAKSINTLIAQDKLSKDFKQILKQHLNFLQVITYVSRKSLSDYLKEYAHVLDINELLQMVSDINLQYEICHNYADISEKVTDLRKELYDSIGDANAFSKQLTEIIEEGLQEIGYQNPYKDNFEKQSANQEIEKLLEKTYSNYIELHKTKKKIYDHYGANLEFLETSKCLTRIIKIIKRGIEKPKLSDYIPKDIISDIYSIFYEEKIAIKKPNQKVMLNLILLKFKEFIIYKEY